MNPELAIAVPPASLCSPSAEALFEALSCLADEDQKLIFRNANYGDTLMLGFGGQEFCWRSAWYEK
jgi:hypothetical protein